MLPTGLHVFLPRSSAIVIPSISLDHGAAKTLLRWCPELLVRYFISRCGRFLYVLQAEYKILIFCFRPETGLFVCFSLMCLDLIDWTPDSRPSRTQKMLSFKLFCSAIPKNSLVTFPLVVCRQIERQLLLNNTSSFSHFLVPNFNFCFACCFV